MALRLRTSLVVGVIALTGLGVAVPAIAASTGRSDKIKTALSPLVKDGTITQDQADKVADTLATVPLEGGPGLRPGHDGVGPDAAAVAKALGLTEEQLRTELRAGKSLAAIAKAHNVDVANVIAVIVDAEKARIAAKVKDGSITQAQADERLAGLTARVTERVNSTRPAGGRGGGGFGGGFGGGPGGVVGGRIDADSAALAKVLGLTEEQLRTELQTGKSLAAIAKAHNVDVAKVVAVIVDAQKARIAADVKSGRITQAQADERLEDLTARVTERVNSTRPSGGPGGHGGPRGGGFPGGGFPGGGFPGSPDAPAAPAPAPTS